MGVLDGHTAGVTGAGRKRSRLIDFSLLSGLSG
jgi:hypothetical protein